MSEQPEQGTASEQPLDSHALHTALMTLLKQHPDALITAINLDGLFIPVPEGLPTIRHRPIKARSAFDLVVTADRVVVVDTWHRARNTGAARASVHLASYPDESVVMHFIDASEHYGVFIGLVLVADGKEALVGISDAPPVMPRVCHTVKDERAIYTDVDDAATQILGWSKSEMLGLRGLEFIHPDDQDRAIENWLEMLSGATGQRVRLRHQRKDGSWVWMEITNHNHLDDPENPHVLGESIDISDEMAAHEALRAREQLLRRLADALPTGVLQIAPDRSVIYTNDRLHDIVGIGPLTTVRTQLAAVEPEQWPLVDEALDAVFAGEDRDIEIILRLPATGDRRLCQFNLRSLTEEDGSVTGAIVSVADVTESAQLRKELEHRATFDALTGCHNRASIMAVLDAELAKSSGDVAVVFIDLVKFKAINDDLGHAAGDELLVVTADRLRDVTRGHDTVGRLGGDEFLVVCTGVSDEREAAIVAERVAAALCRTTLLAVGPVDLLASVGVVHSSGGETADELVARADAAMYLAKSRGSCAPVVAPSKH